MKSSHGSNPRQEEYADKFPEAANDWDLDRLYSDLREAKQKLATGRNRQRVTELEKACLRGFLSSYSPDEIATELIRGAKGLRVDLSRYLYRYVEALTGREPNELQNWRDIADWLEEAGYKTPPRGRVDWGEAPEVSVFYGRTSELQNLKRWIVTDKCRLVAVLGMGGIGKTALAVKLAQEIQEEEEFDYVIWRSLRDAPPIEELLAKLLQYLSNQSETDLPETVNGQIEQLIDYVRQHRCLLVLDHWEAIFQSGKLAGNYKEGYDNYAELLRRMGESPHQSCLMLTSRERPREIAALLGPDQPVRDIQMEGLGADAREILKKKGLSGENKWGRLIDGYAGNPLGLKLASTMIIELYNGNVDEFLKLRTLVFGQIWDLLYNQIQRSSDLERNILFWLAREARQVSLPPSPEDISLSVTPREIIDAMQSLRRRSLIERITGEKDTIAHFTLQPMVMEFILSQKQ